MRSQFTIVAALLVTIGVAGAEGAPVSGKVMTHRQPDGSTVQVRVWGDEFFRIVEALDGYTLQLDSATGFACYARLSDDGNALISTGVVAGQGQPGALGLTPHLRISRAAVHAQVRAARARFEAGRRMSSGMQHKTPHGNVKGLCLIVDFSDEHGVIPASAVADYCNTPGYSTYGNHGSVRDYYYDVSNGKLTYTNYVPPSYYRASHPKGYYTDPAIEQGTRARELIIEALNSLQLQGLDFQQFDSDGDGVIDALNCFYAGPIDNAWAEGLWPHSWDVTWSGSGVQTGSYQISNMTGMYDDLPTLLLGTFCHENGHMLCGWPDLYDYEYDSAGAGMFCLMAMGTTDDNPCQPCAPLKEYAGWGTTTPLTTPQVGLTLPSAGNVIYRYNKPGATNEYFIIENRQRTGRDVDIPAAGLALWHVDENGSNDYEDMLPDQHYQVTLVQADGRWDLEHYDYWTQGNPGDSQDLWYAPTRTRCGPWTNPSTNWWDRSESGLWLWDISTSSSAMTFTFGPDCNTNNVPDSTDIASGTSKDCNGNGVPDECDIAAGSATDCNNNGVPDVCETGIRPGIVTQPAPTMVHEGAAASLSVSASGLGQLSYQWYLGGKPVIGATRSVLEIAAAGPDNAGAYTVVVSSSCGSVTSDAALLQISPAIPSRPSPANLAQNVTALSPLTWTGGTVQTSYEVYFGQANPPPLAATVSTASWTPSVLESDTTYYWRIVARNGVGTGEGPVWLFTTQQAPPTAPEAPYPADGAVGVPTNVTLAWGQAKRAAFYKVLIGPEAMLKSLPFQGSTQTEQWAAASLTPGTRYYWQVIAKNDTGYTSSPIWSFTTAAPVVQPQPPAQESPPSQTPAEDSSLSGQTTPATTTPTDVPSDTAANTPNAPAGSGLCPTTGAAMTLATLLGLLGSRTRATGARRRRT